MTSYDELVKAISNSDKLNNAIAEILEDREILNLVCEDWESQLERCNFIQLLQKDPSFLFGKWQEINNGENTYQKIKFEFNKFKILLAGEWYFDTFMKKSVMYTENNEVLDKICRIMFSDVEKPVNYSTWFRFETIKCDTFLCGHCKFASEHFSSKGSTIPNIQALCATNAEIFDGKEVKNILPSLIAPKSRMLGVVVLSIDTRSNARTVNVSALDTVKISGKAHSCLLFKENNLKPIAKKGKLYFGSDYSMAGLDVEQPTKQLQTQSCITSINEDDKAAADAMMNEFMALDDDTLVEIVPTRSEMSRLLFSDSVTKD